MKDPLQAEPTPYELLGVTRTADAEEVASAFRHLLAKGGNVQALTAARRLLQQPVERALVDLFLYDEHSVSVFFPELLRRPAALLVPDRWQTANVLIERLRRCFPDWHAVHTTAVFSYWSALHIESRLQAGAPVPGAPPAQHLWEQAIACWTMIAASEAYWLGPGKSLTAGRPRVLEVLRTRLQDCEQPYRDAGDTQNAEIYQYLEESLDAEQVTVQQFVGSAAGISCGQLMMRIVSTSAGTGTSDDRMHVGRVRALLQRSRPQAALDAFLQLPATARRTDEYAAVGAEVYRQLAAERASLGLFDQALDAWEEAFGYLDAGGVAGARKEVAALCLKAAVTLQHTQRDAAIRILTRGLSLAPDEKLRLTLAELRRDRVISAVNEALDRSRRDETAAPATIETIERATSELEEIVSLGLERARTDIVAVQRLLVRVRWGSRRALSIDLDSLPPEVRTRFAACVRGLDEPGPVHSVLEQQPTPGARLAVCLLALVLLGGLTAMGCGANGLGAHHPFQMVALTYIPLLFVSAWALGAALHARAVRAAQPFPPGQYLFPVDFVDARTPVLRVLPFQRLTKFAPASRPDGRFELQLQGTSGESDVMIFTFPQALKAVVDRVAEAAAQEERALSNGDVQALRKLDPLFDLHGMAQPASGVGKEGPGRPVAPYLRWRVPAAAVFALLIAFPLAWVRNTISDERRFAEARRIDTVRSYRSYLLYPGSHATDAYAALPRAAFREAQTQNTIAAFKQVIAEFPQTDGAADAADEIAKIYRTALDRFANQPRPPQPHILKFMESLLGHMQRTGRSVLAVHFRPPTVARSLRPFFNDSTASNRERDVSTRLGNAFRQIFRTDVLALSHQGRTIDVEAAKRTGPVVLVTYNVSASGSYSLESLAGLAGRQFTGIRVDFDVEISAPQVPGQLSFDLTVRPPDRFTVSSSNRFSDPSTTSVYDTMTARAFDQLAGKLEQAFFGASDGTGER